jgi:hypothetical protein
MDRTFQGFRFHRWPIFTTRHFRTGVVTLS